MHNRLRTGTHLLLLSLLAFNFACTPRVQTGTAENGSGTTGNATVQAPPAAAATPEKAGATAEAPAATETTSKEEPSTLNTVPSPATPQAAAENTRAGTEVSSEIKWLSLDEAYKLNQKEPRKIFVDVYTNWCGWCKKMDKDTFGDPEVARYVNEHYYAVKLNAESDRKFKLGEAEMTDRQVAGQMGVSGYPTVVFIYEDFKTILPVSGYHQPNQFIKMLQAFSRETIKQ